MQPFQHLLVALANRDADDDLLAYVAEVAELGAARTVHFVHVAGESSDGARAAALEAARARIGRHIPADGGAFRLAVVDGPVVDGLLTYALDHAIDLTLVGHGCGRPGRKSLARRLAMKAPCSVWMVPEKAPRSMQRILVPVDYSAPSGDALAVAAGLLRRRETGEVLTLHVYFNELMVSFEEYEEQLRGEQEELLRAFDAQVADLGVPVHTLVEHGTDVAEVVARAAEEHGADLLVMSTRGRSRSASVLLGSVTEDVIVATRRPLLVVKHFGAKMGLLQALLCRSERSPSLHYN